MDDQTLATANFWLPYIDRVKFWAEVGVIGSLAIGLIAARVAAPFQKTVDDAKDLKIAELGKEANEAKAGAVRAQAELAKFRSPRLLPPKEMEALTAAAKPFAGTEYDGGLQANDPEQLGLWFTINIALKQAGWKLMPWAAPTQLIQVIDGSTLATGLSVSNVFIALRQVSTMSELAPAANALADALKKMPGLENTLAGPMMDGPGVSKNNKAIHILIGRRT